jgi:hypothetical protein
MPIKYWFEICEYEKYIYNVQVKQCYVPFLIHLPKWLQIVLQGI